jgi:serine/threonine-protein kinase
MELSGGRFQVVEPFVRTRLMYLYRAFDRQTDQTVVVKVVRPDRWQQPHFARRFVRETAALIPLAHPHLVSVFDVGEHAGLPFAVVADMTGKNLWERRTRWHEACLWLPAAAAALDYLEAQGFVQRSLSPSEILFAADQRVAVSESGIVRAAPGEPPHCFRLAATLYASLDEGRLSAGPAHGTVTPAIPPALWDVLQPALSPDASVRTASCAEFAARVVAAVAAESARAGCPQLRSLRRAA